MSVEQSQGKDRKARVARCLLIAAAIIINLGIIALLVNQVIHKNWLDRKEPYRPDLSFQVAPLNKKGRSEVRRAVLPSSIHEWPSLQARQVGNVEGGETVRVNGTTAADGLSWYRVIRYGGKTGFIDVNAIDAQLGSL